MAEPFGQAEVTRQTGSRCPVCKRPLAHISHVQLGNRQSHQQVLDFERFYCPAHGSWRVYADGRIVADAA